MTQSFSAETFQQISFKERVAIVFLAWKELSPSSLFQTDTQTDRTYKHRDKDRQRQTERDRMRHGQPVMQTETDRQR